MRGRQKDGSLSWHFWQKLQMFKYPKKNIFPLILDNTERINIMWMIQRSQKFTIKNT